MLYQFLSKSADQRAKQKLLDCSLSLILVVYFSHSVQQKSQYQVRQVQSKHFRYSVLSLIESPFANVMTS